MREHGRVPETEQRVRIESADDPRLGDYIRLRETSLRRHLEAERGLFIAEGEKVIRRAVEAGYRPRSFLLAERWLHGLADVLATWPDVPVYVVTEALAEEVTGFHVHRGASSAPSQPRPAALRRMAPTLVWSTTSSITTSRRAVASSSSTV